MTRVEFYTRSSLHPHCPRRGNVKCGPKNISTTRRGHKSQWWRGRNNEGNNHGNWIALRSVLSVCKSLVCVSCDGQVTLWIPIKATYGLVLWFYWTVPHLYQLFFTLFSTLNSRHMDNSRCSQWRGPSRPLNVPSRFQYFHIPPQKRWNVFIKVMA